MALSKDNCTAITKEKALGLNPRAFWVGMTGFARLRADGAYETEEGCLSLLGGPRKCKRYKTVKVQWQTAAMQTRIKTFSGWTAQIIQHEIDHCNGILI